MCPRVSIHAPVMDAIIHYDYLNLRYKSFNPRARDGRDSLMCRSLHSLDVSIHAPVMDAIAGNVVLLRGSWFQSTRP